MYPTIGKLTAARVTTAMVADVIDRVQRHGVRETAQKVLQHVRRCSGAQVKVLRPDNPAGPVVEILSTAPGVVHNPALLTFPELGDVLRRSRRTSTRACGQRTG